MGAARVLENEYVFTGAVRSSGAYDIDRWGKSAPLPELELPRNGVVEEAEPEAVVRERAEVSVRSAVSPAIVLGFAVAAIMLCLVLLSYVRLTELSVQAGEVANELTELQTTYTKLRVVYESTFDLEEIETYARDVLGMTTPEAEQINYVDFSTPDKAVILEDTDVVDDAKGIVSGIRDFLVSITEYFK